MRAVVTACWCGALWTSACFTGTFLAGRPCTRDDDCGPRLRCEQGVCGGVQPAGTSTGGTGMSTTPTTGGLASTDDTSGTSGASGTSTGSSTGVATTGTHTAGVESSGSESSTGDRCADATCGPLDLLLIVDDSPSMAQWQPALGDALQSLDGGPVGEILRGSCDTHIGVLVTGTPYAANPKGCQEFGALVRIGAQPCAGVAPFATQDDDLTDALACRISVGSGGSNDERPVQALLRALTPEYNDPGACNDGFFRPDALLVIVLVTDEDDDADPEDELPGAETPGSPQEWFDAVVAFKGSAERVVVLALIGDSQPVTLCPWLPDPDNGDGSGAETPVRLQSFIDLFPRHGVDSLCQGDYSGFIAGPVLTRLQEVCAGA